MMTGAGVIDSGISESIIPVSAPVSRLLLWGFRWIILGVFSLTRRFQRNFPMIPNLSMSSTQPVHLYSVRLSDLRVISELDRWLPEPEADEEDIEVQSDTCTELQTSTKMQIFYLALMSVVIESGMSQRDRFVKNKKFLPLGELKTVTVSGEQEKQHALDSLADLVGRAYKKMSVMFRPRLSRLENNFQLFWFYRHVFQAALSLLQQYARDEFSGSVHTKSLLTILLKQKNPNTLIDAVKRFL